MTVRSRLRRHPVPMQTRFGHSLVLAYAFPAEVLTPLLPPGLTLDTYGSHGFVAIAAVRAQRLRPQGFPRYLGRSYHLTGYRIFVRHHDESGRMRRGLHILRSDTDRRSMALGGNALTHYRYRRSAIRFAEHGHLLEIEIATADAEADLHVVADLASCPSEPPPGSPFAGTTDARRFAGPLPWTFDHEPETGSIVMVRGRRTTWDPRPVDVEVAHATFLDDPRFGGATPILANAFHIEHVDYAWDRGVVTPVTP